METSEGFQKNNLLPTPEAKNHEGYQNSHGRKALRLGALISSREDFPANLSAKPDEEKERATTAISGQKCLGLFENSGRDGSSVKMLRDFLLSSTAWYSNKCALTWNRKPTKSNRLLFQLLPSTRRTGGTGFGLLLTTPQASDLGRKTKYQQGGTALSAQVEMLPSPRSSPNENRQTKRSPSQIAGRRGKNLASEIAMMPTPSTRDWKGASKMKPRDTMDSLIERGATKGGIGTETGLKLQPNFVEWMMGYPQNWTDLNFHDRSTGSKGSKDSATHGFRKSQLN
jgi:hypothetical protein